MYVVNITGKMYDAGWLYNFTEHIRKQGQAYAGRDEIAILLKEYHCVAPGDSTLVFETKEDATAFILKWS